MACAEESPELSRSTKYNSEPSLLSLPATPQRGARKPSALDMEIFRCEGDSEGALNKSGADAATIMLENPEGETRWYFRYFLGHSHENYMTHLVTAAGKEPVVLSVLTEFLGGSSSLESKQIRAILWSKAGSERLLLPVRGKTHMDPKKIIFEFGKGLADKRIELISSADVQRDLLVLEEQEGAVCFKFGILPVLPGQTTDDEMFSNEVGTPAFDTFCADMGTVVQLREWKGFRGGLDVKNATTGERSVHTTESGKEIMFHVSTMLPYSRENPQQLERKRHLGNDICNIIFLEEEGTPFSPDMIKSKFNHIFAVVSRQKETGHYTLKVFTRSTVPEYGPPLPSPAVFADPRDLRRFLLVKLMNGEKSALASPHTSFAMKRARTLQALLVQIHESYGLSSRSIVNRSPRVARKQVEESFRSAGQAIKVEKVAAGSAPTSQQGFESQAAMPWTPVCVARDLAHIILCSSSWESDLVVGTTAGLLHLPFGAQRPSEQAQRVLVDESLIIAQLEFDETSSMVYMLAVKYDEEEDDRPRRGRRGILYACPLSELLHRDRPLNKKTMRPFQIPTSKDAQLFAVNRENDTVCLTKLAVAVGRKIRVFQLNRETQSGIAGGGGGAVFFVMTHEATVADNVETLAIGHGNAAGSAGQICAGLRTGDFVSIDLETGIHLPLLGRSEEFKCEPVVCMNVPSPRSEMDYGDHEWLLCYNQIVVFKDTGAQTARFFDVRFSARPHGVAYVYPYLLGFLSDSIEIITLINGSLVKTMTVPGLSFLCAKHDVYFTSFGREGGSNIFRISRDSLAGKHVLADGIKALSFVPTTSNPAFV
eukprot:m.94018 g.94018  ORF g.94018 m.94018 type:complete len:823 (-) comp13837_c0_seq1:24-2492(-)